MSEEAPLFDASAFDVDGQATVTSGTWSFDSSATINSSEVNVTGVALELNVAAISVVTDVSRTSVTLSRIPFAYEVNLIKTITIDYSPYADANDTTLKRQIVVGDPASKVHGIVMEQFFYGETHMTCGIAGLNTNTDFYLKCYGNSKVEAGGTNEVVGKTLSLKARGSATMSGDVMAQMMVKKSFLTITENSLNAKANDVYISGSGKVEISAPKDSLQLFGQKVNIDSSSTVTTNPAPSAPKAVATTSSKGGSWKGTKFPPFVKWVPNP